MNPFTEVLITLFSFIIIILFICWVIPANKIKVAKGLLKVLLPRIPIASIVSALNKKNKTK